MLDLKKLPEELFKVDVKDIEIGAGGIYLYDKKEIEEAQIGYRYDDEGNQIKDWFGDEYVVIGQETACGDPIIAKIDEEDIPIYYMFHDDWSTFGLLSKSFSQFEDLLKMVEEINLYDKEDCEQFLNSLKKELPENAYDFWEGLITVGYEFLTDEEFFE